MLNLHIIQKSAITFGKIRFSYLTFPGKENPGNWTLSATGVFAMFQPCTDKSALEKIHRKLRLIEVELLPPNLKLKKSLLERSMRGMRDQIQKIANFV